MITGSALPSRVMSNAPRPLFPVPSNVPSRTPEENVKVLGALCHVVESKGCYALVHASPLGCARIASELGLEVFPSKRGGEYYAVKIARSAPFKIVPPGVGWRGVADAIAAPKVSAPVDPSVSRLVINGAEYIVRETNPKRRMDSRRWEVRRNGEMVAAPYVVTFQSSTGSEAQCGCKDWIYRRHQCKHIQAIQAAFGGNRQRELALQTG